jgi:4-amino-4-deoxy-L-arabinose transferase-like glycosyltransferase
VPRLRQFGAATLVVGIAISIRVYDIGRQSLWTDELFSRYYADLFGLKFLWTTGLLRENSPPLYYMAIDAWMRLFGTSEAALRSLSLVASVLALPLIYLLGRELFDRRRALLAMLVFALSPLQVDFAQEARTYALLLVPVGMVLLAVARLLRRDVRIRTLTLYAAGSILALYCHATAVFLIAACNIVVIGNILTTGWRDQRSSLARWIVVNVLVGVAALPELVSFVVIGRSGLGIEWIPPLRPADIVRALSPVIVGNSTPHAFPGIEISALLIVCLVGTLWTLRSARQIWLLLVAVPAIFALLIALVSLRNQIFIARVFCWFGIPLALLLAYALASRSVWRPATVVMTVAACLTGLGYQLAAPQKEPWRELIAQLRPELDRADHVVLAPLTDPTPFAYYAPDLVRPQIWRDRHLDNVENDDIPRRMGVHWIAREQLLADIRSGSDTWLIVRTPDLGKVDALLAEVPPPSRRLERTCGKTVCIEALAWTGSAKE